MTADEKSQRGQNLMAEIENDRKKGFENAGFTPNRVAKELAVLAFSDMADYIGADTGGDYVKPVSEIAPKEGTRAIKKLKLKQLQPIMQVDGAVRETLQTEIELYDKLAAIRLAVDIIGWNAPQRQIVGFTEETLNAFISGLPTGIAEAVRAELGRIVSQGCD